jgi:UDP-N-acetylmuramoyl-L-alanyl-D-glutamate--2,6-diaminopimelate ligase
MDEFLSDATATGGRAADVIVEPDRRSAIAVAIDLARPGDLVLVAGKGHETVQEIGAERLPFDDRQVAAELLGLPS